VAHQFNLPDVGEGLTEAEIITWHVAVGDTVSLNQVLLEVETAKAVVELPSPYAGTVLELLHDVGDVVPVGAPIITIGDPAGTGTPEDSTPAQSSLEVPATADRDADGGLGSRVEEPRQAVLVGYGARTTAVARRPRRPGPPAAPPVSAGTRPLASPPVRKFARSQSVDLATIKGTGPRGQITRDDILAVVRASSTVPAAPESDRRIPVSGTRKYIAEAMVRSAFTAPHVTEWLAVDITRTLKLIRELREAPANQDLRITPLTLVARAAIITLGRHSDINASWDESAGEIVQHRDINLGIAVSTPRGLIVPNIRAAQRLGFAELCASMAELITDARANRTTVEAMRGGTFTISNVGVFGVDGATPILNPGESAILALGQTRQLPWNHKGRIRLRSVTTLSLSFDHRLVDGELGSRVLAEIAEILEHPARASVR
jgi:pyruvate dehydrogenase E2 component (dihydrolipoamide acetyltransferase)